MHAEIAISPNSALPYVRLASIALRQQQPRDESNPPNRRSDLLRIQLKRINLLGRAALEMGDTVRSVRRARDRLPARSFQPGGPLQSCKGVRESRTAAKGGEQERARFMELNALADARRRQGNQAYQGPHDAMDMSVSQKPSGITAPN